MPFGLNNAHATFMHLINDNFTKYFGKIVIIYLDVILIYSNTWEEDVQDVHLILELLRSHHLHVKEHKSFFGQKSV